MSIKIIIINWYKMKPLTVSLILLNEMEEQFNYELLTMKRVKKKH